MGKSCFYEHINKEVNFIEKLYTYGLDHSEE